MSLPKPAILSPPPSTPQFVTYHFVVFTHRPLVLAAQHARKSSGVNRSVANEAHASIRRPFDNEGRLRQRRPIRTKKAAGRDRWLSLQADGRHRFFSRASDSHTRVLVGEDKTRIPSRISHPLPVLLTPSPSSRRKDRERPACSQCCRRPEAPLPLRRRGTLRVCHLQQAGVMCCNCCSMLL